MMRHITGAVLTSLLVIGVPMAVKAQSTLPVVQGGGATFGAPATAPPGAPPQSMAAGAPSAPSAAEGVPASVMTGIDANVSLKPRQVTIKAAPNAMVQTTISRAFLNRIVTPFDHPEIKTTSPIQLNTVGSSVFVSIAPTQIEPIVLYIMDRGDDNDSIALMLTPRNVGPVEINIEQPSLLGTGPQRFNPRKATNWERNAPYTDRIIALLRTIAKGLVPPGYAFRVYGVGDHMPLCQQQGLSVVPRQVIDGQTLETYVGAMTNTTATPIEFREASCAHRDVLAVASWPGPLLQPGQSTEVYVVVKRTSVPYGDEARPSALAGVQ